MVKKLLAIISACVFVSVSCTHKVSEPVNFNVLLSPDNSYAAGAAVEFVFNPATVDNLVFYSGEPGHVYNPDASSAREPGSGVVIKNIQDNISAYRHIYTAPGLYKAVFVGTSVTYQSSEKLVKELDVLIIPAQ